MVEAVRGDGRIGLVGLVSELKDLIVDILSGTAAVPAFAAKEGPPGLWRRMPGIWYVVSKKKAHPGISPKQ